MKYTAMLVNGYDNTDVIVVKECCNTKEEAKEALKGQGDCMWIPEIVKVQRPTMYIVTWYELGFIEHEYEFDTKEEAESFYWSMREDGESVSISDGQAEYDPVF